MFFWGLGMGMNQRDPDPFSIGQVKSMLRICFYLLLTSLSLHRREGKARSKSCGSHFLYMVIPL